MATPILQVDDIFVSEGPNSTAIFFLRLSQPAAVAASLSYFWSSGSADGVDQPTDFPGVGSNGSVSFAVGESVQAITIPIIEDNLVERPESFTLKFTSPVNLVLARTSAVATIIDNDTISAVPLVFVTDTWVNETDGVAFFDITLTQASATAITVNYQTVAMTALAGSDFIADVSSVIFAPGETTKTVMLELLDDGVLEGREKFGLQLTAATGGAVIGNPLGTATIAPSDGVTAVTPTLNVSDVTVTEGPVAVATFVLTLSQPSAGLTSVRYSLQQTTADHIAGILRNVDYLDVSGTVTFDAGETVRTVRVPITDDTAIEQAEMFFLQLSEPNGLTLSRSYVPATIIDNDSVSAAPLVSVNDLYVNESDGEAQFVITLDRASTSTITIDFQTADASALAGSDYVGLKSSVVFLPGETAKTIAVTLNDDASAEIDERFSLKLTGASGGAVLFDAEGTAVIAQNDGTLAASPILVIEDIVVGENAPLTFVLRLTQPSAGPASVTYAVSSGTAVNTTDYWYNSDTVRFAPGETVKVVTLSNIDNAVVEQAEYLQLSLSSPQGMTLSKTRVIANIIDNDATGAAPSVTVSDAIVNEGSGEAQFIVVLDRASTVPITITYKTTDGSAVAGSDFVGATSTLTFLPGDVAKKITIQLLEDAQAEADEQFVVELTGATGGAVLADATGTATISHNDGLTSASPVLNVDDVVVSEGPNSFATFVLRLNRPSTSMMTVSYNAEFSTADSGLDYGYVTDTIRFAPGETVKTVKIPIIDDNDVEGINSVLLLLSSPQGLSLGKAYAVGRIIDNDTIGAAPLIRAGDAVVNESGGFAKVAITLDRASTSAITVTYQTVNGQALAGSDFVGVSSSVTFLPGETAKTVAIQLFDDASAEAEERFGLTLTNVTGGGVLAHSEGIVTIGRSDGAAALQPVLNVADVVVGEGGDSTMTFVLRLSQPSTAATSVSLNLTGGTAGSTFDYSYMPDTVTFAPGETIKTFSVLIVQDSENEQAETLSLVLRSGQGLTLGRPLAMATIVDDDTTFATPSLSVGDVYVNESDGEAYFSLTFNGATTSPVTVTFQTVDGLAVAGTDYVARSGSVIFMPGETAKTVGVQLIDDGLPQLDATFGLRITGVTGSAVVTDGIGTALIGRNDLPAVALPVLRVDDILVGEGGLSLATFVLRLSQPATVLASVTVGLAFGGTANFADYKDLGSYTVNFGVGETVKTFSIPLVDDGVPENAETLLLELHSATGMTIERSKAVGTIIDNDGPVLVAGVDSVKAEGQGGSTAMTFAVMLKEALPSSQVLNWSVAGFGTRAASAADFVGNALPGGSVTFASGETFKLVTVNVAGDAVFEGDETFVLTVTDPSGTLGIGTVQALGTIVDDDTAAVTISTMTASAVEGNTISSLFTFTVSLGQAATAPQSVGWAVYGSGANAASAADFVGGALPSGTVDFAIGETSKTITVEVAADSQLEADETFIVGVTSTTGLPVGSFLAQATILNDDVLSVSIAAAAATKAEGQGGSTAFTFTVSLDVAAPSPRSVGWAVTGSGGNAASAADFAGGVLPSGTVTFAAGETTKTITISTASDSAIEPDEAFVVTLTNPASGLAIGTASAGGTILNDDASVSIAAAAASKAEGSGGGTAFTFTVTRSGDTSVGHSVGYAVSGAGGNPADGADFVGGVLPIGTVSFLAGETSRSVTVTVAGDIAPEIDEGFVVALSSPSPGLTVGTATASGTIVNDDTSISVAATLASRLEGASGTTQFTFSATRLGDTSAPHTVSYAVTGSGANPASAADFAGGVLPSGTVSFAIGETSKTITVDVAGDTAPEPDEGFALTLSNPSPGVTLGSASASATILSDDATLSIVALSAVKAEGQAGTTQYTFTVTRTGDTSAPHTISYVVAGSGANATDAADFTGGALPAGTVTFAVGETSKTLTIGVAGDSSFEADETFSVTVSGPVGGPFVGSANATGTIVNDDATLSIAAASAVKSEGQAGAIAFSFTVTRTGDTTGTHGVTYAVTGTGANPAGAADFVGGALPTGAVTFAAGETARTITVDVAGDALVESDEAFAVTLSAPGPGATIGTASATGAIQNDDASVSVAILSATKAEGQAGITSFTFTVTRTGDISVAHTVTSAVAGSGANPASGADFAGGVLPTSIITFAAGETSKTVTVDVVDDALVEPNETFSLILSNSSSGLVLGAASAIGTIQNDDARVSIAALSASKAEGNTGTTAFTFQVTLTGDTSIPRSVAWVVGGTGAAAAAATDFVGGAFPSGVLSFSAGETSKILTVNVAGDTALEASEAFVVNLSAPSTGLVLGTASATGTIQDDDSVPTRAHDDAFIVLQGQALHVTAPSGVLANDTGGAPVSATLLGGASHGIVTVAGSGAVDFTAAPGFTGVDSFTYRTSASAGADDGQAHIYVVPVSTGQSTILNLLALTPEEQIAATYAAFFGRGADAGGFGFWVGEFVQGIPAQGPAALFANIASSFGVSPEARALYPFLADPLGANDSQISAFLNKVYNNLFNRSSDVGGLGYWTDQVKQTLQSGGFVGSVLVNIISGTQESANSKDITTLMGKVAVSLAFVREQDEHDTPWAGPADVAAATALLLGVTSDPLSILTGIRSAETLIANHV